MSQPFDKIPYDGVAPHPRRETLEVVQGFFGANGKAGVLLGIKIGVFRDSSIPADIIGSTSLKFEQLVDDISPPYRIKQRWRW